jgi:hypothetical protein
VNDLIVVAHLAMPVQLTGIAEQFVCHCLLLNNKHKIVLIIVMEPAEMDTTQQIIILVKVRFYENLVTNIKIKGSLVDIDECKSDLSICGNGTCVNIIGSYTCNCTSGYRFNNQTCIGKFFFTI